MDVGAGLMSWLAGGSTLATSSFPATSVASSAAAPPPATLLDALVVLGMRREVDLSVLLAAAEGIAQEFQEEGSPTGTVPTLPPPAAAGAGTATAAPVVEAVLASVPPPSAATQGEAPQLQHPLVSRAKALLQLLDGWAETHPHPTIGSDARKAWIRLASVAWCPVILSAPEPGACVIGPRRTLIQQLSSRCRKRGHVLPAWHLAPSCCPLQNQAGTFESFRHLADVSHQVCCSGQPVCFFPQPHHRLPAPAIFSLPQAFPGTLHNLC